ALAAAALGVAWLGVCLGHGVLLRELPHGGALLIAVLLATFLGDTAAQLVGTAFGRTRLASAISPNKTVEGLLAGVVGGTSACALFLVLAHEWISAGQALALGLACSLAAPAGDLFESALKRRAGVKDSGRAFGAHGGALDRVDAALVAALAGYHVAHAIVAG
ncbi:MAG: phosphatidate cytidylyltransferase, partial [Actinomycetota bacterium]|nr:phosphatidate cytidylyltransferase [Actinomycetota bacterium]